MASCPGCFKAVRGGRKLVFAPQLSNRNAPTPLEGLAFGKILYKTLHSGQRTLDLSPPPPALMRPVQRPAESI